tara:strand:+ start:137 stop:295 length:159 start_codon:yes stop_codon:yes gene_type:complete
MKITTEMTNRERWLMIVAMEEYVSLIERSSSGQMDAVISECKKIISNLEESK